MRTVFLWRVYAVSVASISISYAVRPNFSIAVEDFPVAAPMSIDRDHNLLHELHEQLRRCETITPDLMLNVICRACFRFHAHGPEVKARVARLIDCGAYTDATLALLEL